ncbi:hypothetical protein [Roseateles sp.]|nr:hypothetical protein [Roseateles sp.]
MRATTCAFRASNGHTAVGQDAAGDASGNHLGAERDALLRGIVARYGNW